MHLEVIRPGLCLPWRYIGIYQHVSKRAPHHNTGAELVRQTVAAILQQASIETHHVLILGDVNAAPTWTVGILIPQPDPAAG